MIFFEPKASQIEKIMERIFMQYYKMCDKDFFKPSYEAIPMMEKQNDQ